MEWNSVSTWAVRLAAASGGIAAVGLGLLYRLQDKLIYVPRIPGVPNDLSVYPDRLKLYYEDIWLTAQDGTRLHAWYMHPQHWRPSKRRERPVFLFFQENAGNMAMRLHFLRNLANYVDCSILAASYRGYGLSEGTPTEAGLVQDSQAALDYLVKTREDIDNTKIAVFGKSLGGAVAIHVAAANVNVIAAVIVENTFLSILDIAAKVLPFLWLFIGRNRLFNFLLRNRWQNDVQIVKLARVPMLLLSSAQDEMLPPKHMRDLYNAVGGEASSSCTLVTFAHAHHMDAYEVAAQEYWPAILDFCRRSGLFTD